MFNERKNLNALPGMEDALAQVQAYNEAHAKGKKKDEKKPKRWWDDDGDGKGWEKGEVDGSFKKEEVETIWEEIVDELGDELDELTDEQLEEIIYEALDSLEDDEELYETIEYLDEMVLLDQEYIDSLAERVDPKETQRRRDQAKDRLATSSAMKSAAAKSAASPAEKASRVERVKAVAKGAAAKAKAGVKAVGKSVASAAGKVAGTYKGEKEAARIKAKRASMQNTPAKKKDDDDDGTGRKLDALLKSARGTDEKKTEKKPASSGSTSAGSGTSTRTTTTTTRTTTSSGGSSSSGETRRAVGGALKKVGGAIVKGAKKVVGKTARGVSKAADWAAKKLGEDVDCPVCGQDPCQCLEGTLEEGKNKEGKEQGVDGKACWKGYRYAGTENGKDKCVPANEELEAMEASLMESGLFSDDEVRYIIGEKFDELDEATAMAKRGHDETAIRNKIAANTGGGKSADRATALEKKPTYGDSDKEKQRSRYARAQRGDFRKTTSSSPGLHGYGHKATNAADKAKQAARGAQRGALTPNEKKDLGR